MSGDSRGGSNNVLRQSPAVTHEPIDLMSVEMEVDQVPEGDRMDVIVDSGAGEGVASHDIKSWLIMVCMAESSRLAASRLWGGVDISNMVGCGAGAHRTCTRGEQSRLSVSDSPECRL